jgi:hypothetical protein
MAKKKAARKDASAAKPKQLRKRLRKAEDQLQDAQAKRDRAQARFEALSIIADEIRAQLAELEKAEKAEKAEKVAAKEKDGKTQAKGAASTAAKKPATSKTVAKKAAASKTTATTAKPAAAKQPASTAKPAAARKSAAAASKSATATARKTAGSKAKQAGAGSGTE